MSSVTVRWVEKHLMMGSDSNSHSIVIGRSPDERFEWAGIKPSDLLLMALASCALYDIVAILEKQRQPLEDLRAICTGEQLPDPPYTFTKIHVHYHVRGNIDPEKLRKAIRLSEDKYCSVISTLRPSVEISSDFEVFD